MADDVGSKFSANGLRAALRIDHLRLKADVAVEQL